MFFTRLRRHAKWMFVFLALVFGLGFVIFGIGSDQGTGIGDILRDQGSASSDSLSVGEARDRLEENPRDAAAKRALATALQEEGDTAEAITVLEEYVEQRPKDAEALRELAGLHLGRANVRAQQAQEVQLRASYLTFGSTFLAPLKLDDEGSTLAEDPIEAAVTAKLSAEVSAAYTRAQESYTAAEAAYVKLADLVPRDPNIQLELAQAAQQSGNTTRAIAAYERFLELAPDDPTAEIVREQVKALKGTQAPTGSG
jgi:regulator of sirC expression with transglutaminase-like and TPR domain